MFYTYAHYRADSDIPFYVGKGRGDRYKNQTHRNSYWKAVAEKHGVKTEILALWKNESEAYSHEIFLIDTFKRMGFKLTNLSTGGEGGATGVPKTKEHREKISIAQRGVKKTPEQIEMMRGYALKQFSDPIARELARSKQLGKKQSAESSEKKRIAMMGKKQHHLEKKVLCITNGIEYPSIREAARQLNLFHTNISACCNGKALTTGGLRFKHINE